ncbi:hypothetical protein FB639_002949 [Coemansia asiatica]|nr:hypothetical protein FB639_002949 [Coemansia asiatica]
MQKLPDDAVRLIRSAALVVDIGDIAGLLLDNSLDAGATKFQLNIQLDQFSLAARDNGCGIPESDIRLLGQRYYTSKYAARQRPQAPVTRKPIGYRGEALASISHIAVVDIVSRAKGSAKTYRCTVRGESLLHCCECSAADLDGFSTVVRVTNIFSRQPVRQKIVTQTSKKIMDAIKTQMQIRSLGSPEVAMQLFKTSDQIKVFSYSSTGSLNQRIAQIYGPSVACSLDFISFEYEGFQLSGSMSRLPVLGRIQHIFFEGCLWDPPELLVIVESVLAASEYYSRANAADSSVESPSRARARHHPVFVLSITCPTSSAGLGEAEIEYRTRSTGLKVRSSAKPV